MSWVWSPGYRGRVLLLKRDGQVKAWRGVLIPYSGAVHPYFLRLWSILAGVRLETDRWDLAPARPLHPHPSPARDPHHHSNGNSGETVRETAPMRAECESYFQRLGRMVRSRRERTITALASTGERSLETTGINVPWAWVALPVV